MLTATSPIVSGQVSATPAQCSAFILDRPHGEYTDWDISRVIVPAYFAICIPVGINPRDAIAQLIHETNNLDAALAQRRDKDGNNLRNPAGIGVTGAWSRTPKAGYVWDSDRGRYRACVSFADWSRESIPAHVGRLLAYALRDDQATPAQRALIETALAWRGLPRELRGSAPTWRELGAAHNRVNVGRLRKEWIGWAVPGWEYGDKIAAIATALARG